MIERSWQRTRRDALFEDIPCGIVVLDQSLRIVDHNRTFASTFGEGIGKPCYQVTKKCTAPCPDCPARKAFIDGQQRVLEDTASDKSGQSLHYLVQFSPLLDADGRISYMAAITTDLTATKRLRQEYQTLFEKVPCYVAVLNRDRRVVMANEMFRRTFGEPRGEPCYRLFKQRHTVCEDCPAEKTFADGDSHTSSHIGTSRDGHVTHYVVSTAPLLRGDGEVAHVIEMCLDVTETRQLEEELVYAHTLREALIDSSLDAIVVLNEEQRIVLMNEAAERLWEIPRAQGIGRRVPARLVPASLGDLLKGKTDSVQILDTTATNAHGEEIPVRLAGMTLRDRDRVLGAAVIAQDLREIKQLEHDKLEAERLAAVGQTVAGLAHGIKNIMTGLEGGMYVTTTGLKKGDRQRVERGWAMLERNMARISSLARDLLAFSRGDPPKPALIDPARIVREVLELYQEHARQHGIEFETEIAPDIQPASMDAEGIHSALTNLVSNAVDACLVGTQESNRITLRLFERDDCLIFEVADTGCGMDSGVKHKAFTSFFTTKGTGGSGLGLLTTRKIVQQHGGEITFDSKLDEGSTFRLRFCRRRLPLPVADKGRET
jgi:histidine kinase